MNTTDKNQIEVSPDLWLQQNSLLLQTIKPQASPVIYHSAMKNILEEGEGYLGNPKIAQPALRTEFGLVTANAAANLALTEKELGQRNIYLQKCFQLCDQSVEAALISDSSGLVCETTGRAITILIYCKPFVPEEMHDSFVTRAKGFTETLDRYLDFQQIDRQLGAEKLEQGNTLVASLTLVKDPEERRAVLEEAASLILQAEGHFLRARDLEQAEQIQADLGELEKSLRNASHPTPDLAFLKIELQTESGPPPAIKAPVDTPTPVPQAHPPARKRRRSPLLWLFSISGMLVSLVPLFLGGMTMYSAMQGSGITANQDELLQTKVSLYTTMTALSTGAPAGFSQSTQIPGLISTNQGGNVNNLNTQIPGILAPDQTQTLAVSCPGAPPSRLKVSSHAVVSNISRNILTVRAGVGETAEELFYLEPGNQVNIVNGPICLDKQLWWQVRIDQGNFGWVPESRENGEYLLEPAAN